MNYENICLLYINYENMKMFVCKTWIMKMGKYLQYMSYEKIKMFVCNTQIMKPNYLFAKYELKNVYNTWIMKTFVCNTLIMKIGKYLQYMNYEKMKMFAICKLWEQEIICLQYMKYEKNCKTN